MLGGSATYIIDNDGISVEKHYYQKDENRSQSGVALADSHDCDRRNGISKIRESSADPSRLKRTWNNVRLAGEHREEIQQEEMMW